MTANEAANKKKKLKLKRNQMITDRVIGGELEGRKEKNTLHPATTTSASYDQI